MICNFLAVWKFQNGNVIESASLTYSETSTKSQNFFKNILRNYFAVFQKNGYYQTIGPKKFFSFVLTHWWNILMPSSINVETRKNRATWGKMCFDFRSTWSAVSSNCAIMPAWFVIFALTSVYSTGGSEISYCCFPRYFPFWREFVQKTNTLKCVRLQAPNLR